MHTYIHMYMYIYSYLNKRGKKVQGGLSPSRPQLSLKITHITIEDKNLQMKFPWTTYKDEWQHKDEEKHIKKKNCLLGLWNLDIANQTDGDKLFSLCWSVRQVMMRVRPSKWIHYYNHHHLRWHYLRRLYSSQILDYKRRHIVANNIRVEGK